MYNNNNLKTNFLTIGISFHFAHETKLVKYISQAELGHATFAIKSCVFGFDNKYNNVMLHLVFNGNISIKNLSIKN